MKYLGGISDKDTQDLYTKNNKEWLRDVKKGRTK